MIYRKRVFNLSGSTVVVIPKDWIKFIEKGTGKEVIYVDIETIDGKIIMTPVLE